MTLSFNDSTPKEIAMLGIGRRDGSVEVQPSVKTVLGPPPRPGSMPGRSTFPAIPTFATSRPPSAIN